MGMRHYLQSKSHIGVYDAVEIPLKVFQTAAILEVRQGPEWWLLRLRLRLPCLHHPLVTPLATVVAVATNSDTTWE